MPMYEYECEKCGRFEVMQRVSDEPVKTCPHCDNAGVKRLISASALQFKGSGYYITDYTQKSGSDQKSDGSGAAKSGEDQGKASEASTKPSTETKPSTKSKAAAKES